jgi:hypothetical protein
MTLFVSTSGKNQHPCLENEQKARRKEGLILRFAKNCEPLSQLWRNQAGSAVGKTNRRERRGRREGTFSFSVSVLLGDLCC